MIENLKIASKSLHAALEQYLRVCDGLYGSYSQGKVFPCSEDTHQVNNEIASILSYEGRIRDARLTMTRARNRLFSLAPINSLPAEVLAHIFEMVVDSKPCDLTKLCTYWLYDRNKEFAYPDLLMQVCSRWRHIAETHPSLWVHIDFAPEPAHAKLIAKAKVYARRAQPMSLDIHIAGTRNRPSTYNYISLVKFLESLAGRMKALELIITEEQINEFYSLVLEKLLPKANPNIFTRFIIYAQNQHYDVFITPPESRRHSYGNRPDRSHFPVDVSSEVLDRTFTSLKTLHARGVFPPWHSKAYHGLVELRLTSIDGLYSGITEQELMSILKASPRLQILHFALDIINQNSCFLNGPISLHELEELEISASYEFQTEPTLEVGSLLRLITPGTKSLRLMLQTHDYGPSGSWEATKYFLARSNISKFHARSGCLPIDDILRRMPHLTELVFSHLSGGEWGCGFKEEELRRAIKDAPTVKSHLKSWTLRNCTIYLKELQLMLDLYPTKSLVLHNSNVWEDEEVEERISETKLPIMFPAVKFIQDQPEYTYSRRHSEAESDSDS